jgi:hypothetical protein
VLDQPSQHYKTVAMPRGRKDELMSQWCQGVADMAVTLQRWSHLASPWKRYLHGGSVVASNGQQQQEEEPEDELTVSALIFETRKILL